MTKQTFRKQRGGGGTGGDDTTSVNDDSFSGVPGVIKGGRKHRRKHHTIRKHKRHSKHKRRSRRRRGGNPAFLTPAVLLAAQKLIQHNGLSF